MSWNSLYYPNDVSPPTYRVLRSKGTSYRFGDELKKERNESSLLVRGWEVGEGKSVSEKPRVAVRDRAKVIPQISYLYLLRPLRPLVSNGYLKYS
jgi:hypothetical protein